MMYVHAVERLAHLSKSTDDNRVQDLKEVLANCVEIQNGRKPGYIWKATQKAYRACPSLISNCITHGQFVIGSNKLDNLGSHFFEGVKAINFF